MKKIFRIPLIIFVNILIFCLLAELFALGWYLWHDRVIHYSRQLDYSLIEEVEAEELTAHRIHPYLGFMFKPGYRGSSRVVPRNNHGFSSARDYPFQPPDTSEYVIGIFGGSVAELFCNRGGRILCRKLREDDFFRGRKITVLNFARGGYKQPQQLQALTYFLAAGQRFDLVINIDGFNELALAARNMHRGVDPTFPSTMHMDGLVNLIDRNTLTTDKLHSLGRIIRLRERLNRLAIFIERNPLAWLDLLAEHGHHFIESRYLEEIATYDGLEMARQGDSLIHLNPSDGRQVDDRMLDRIVDIWAESSLAMHQLLAGRGIPYYHFIQPNQYYSKHRFSETEARIAMNRRQKIPAQMVRRGYPRLLQRIDGLRRRGVRIKSEVELFDQVDQAVYIDDCCHFSAAGDRLMADDIGGFILSSAGFRARDGSPFPHRTTSLCGG